MTASSDGTKNLNKSLFSPFIRLEICFPDLKGDNCHIYGIIVFSIGFQQSKFMCSKFDDAILFYFVP